MMKNIKISFLLGLFLVYFPIAYAEIYPVTLPPDTDFSQVYVSDERSGSRKMNTAKYDESLPFSAISTNRLSCISNDEFYIKDDRYYFYLYNEDNEDNEVVGHASLNYVVDATWYETIERISHSNFTYINGREESYSSLTPTEGNPYCLYLYHYPTSPPYDNFFRDSEARTLTWSVVGVDIEFLSTDLIQPGLYYLGLKSGIRVDTLYFISRSSNPLGNISIPAKSIAFEVITEPACNISINGNRSLKYHVSTLSDDGIFASENMTINGTCDKPEEPWFNVEVSARVNKGVVYAKNQLMPTIDSGSGSNLDANLFIEGFIYEEDEPVDPELFCKGEGNIMFTGEKITYDDVAIEPTEGSNNGFNLGLTWNLCIDYARWLSPGIYSAAVDLSVYIE